MKTERLFFRRYVEKDKADFTALFTDAAVMKHVGDGVLTETQAEAFWKKLFTKLYPQNYCIWAIFTLEDSRYVGHAGIYRSRTLLEDCELVYFLNRAAWGKGYATEIALKIIEYGFAELHLRKIYATVDDDHPASINVLNKAGMSFERFDFDDKGRFSIYSIEDKNFKI